MTTEFKSLQEFRLQSEDGGMEDDEDEKEEELDETLEELDDMDDKEYE